MERNGYVFLTNFFVQRRNIKLLTCGIYIFIFSGCAVISQNDKPNDQKAIAATFEASKTIFTDRLKVQFEAGKYLTSQAGTEYTSDSTKSTIEALASDYVSTADGYSSVSVLPAFRAPDRLIYVPQKTSYEYSLASGNINVSYAVLHKKRLELWLAAGAAYHQFDLNAKLSGPIDIYANILPVPNEHTSYSVKYVLQDHQTENISFGEHISAALPYIGFESVYKINSLFSISARLSESMNPWSISSSLSVAEGQGRIIYTPKDFINVYLGYKYTKVYVEDIDEKRNFDWELHLNGFAGGVALRF